MRKFAVLVLSLTLGLMTLAGCGTKQLEEEIDPYRTQLYVSNYSGGFGTKWLYNLKTEFEALYKDEIYEDGKKGVQIVINPEKVDGISLRDTISVSDDEVFFNEKMYYRDYVDLDLLLPITDVVKDPLEKFGEAGTIEAKLTQGQKDFLQVDGEYYAIPHYEGYTGLIYDVDLFESEGLYFAKDKDNGNDGFVYDGTDKDERAAGPNGKEGDYDDGLPATYDEFFVLMDKLVDAGITPVGWSGINKHYVNLLTTALQADYEGLEQMMLNYTFTGTAKNLISVNNGQVTRLGDTQITVSDGYKVYQQAGRYYALKFIERMVSDQSYYSTGSYSPSKGHIGAQEDFLYGRFSPQKPRIAMHVDGIWWENEAEGVFTDMVNEYGAKASKFNRKFALMPLPKSGQTGQSEGLTLYNNTHAYGVIKSNITEWKIPLAKDFLRFANTDAALRAFIVETNTPKALKVKYSDFTEQEKEKMTYFGKSLMSMREQADIVYPLAQNELFLAKQADFTLHANLWLINGAQYPVEAMRGSNANKMTAEEYFDGLRAKYSATYWQGLLSGL